MDQNSTNGAGADKRNWRERLGIGAKEMPKISDAFREEPKVTAAPMGTARRAPQPVTKLAPMAPRAPAKPAMAEEPQEQKPAANYVRPASRPIDNNAQDALADKLRAQRAAAEKLAEQRVQAARERAEAKISVTPPAAAETAPKAQPRVTSPAPNPRPASAASPRPEATAARPKFSFAEDEVAPRRDARIDMPVPPRPASHAAAPPPLSPPRPVLGGERGQPPFLRPSAAAASRPQTPSYRPIDPATGYTPPQRLNPAARSQGAEPPPAYGTARPPVRRPPAGEPQARQPNARTYPPDAYHEDPLAGPRLSRPPVARGRPRPPEPKDEFEEVFEDEASPPRQRASVRDYQNAYRETEVSYADDERRSSGPWLLLAALLAAAIIAGGVLWYYNAKMQATTTATSTTTTGQTVPLVEAPQEPPKTAAEQPADTQGQAPAAAKKKLIYDRIVGDQEVTGDQVLSTEETPMQPVADGQPAAADAAISDIPTPDAPASAPDAAPAAAPVDSGQVPAVPEETAPLPLPPPPGNDQQGALDNSGMEVTAAAAGQPEQGSTAPPPPPAATMIPTTTDAQLPPPEPTTEGAALASKVDASKVDAPKVDAITPETANTAEPAQPKPVAEKPAKKKTVAAKPTKKKSTPTAQSEQLGSEPVVLVPSSTPASPTQGTQGTEAAAGAPVTQDGAAPEPVKKKRTLLDLFSRSETNSDVPAKVIDSQETEVASVQPITESAPAPAAEPTPAPAAKPAGGSGYMVQLSSFSSQAAAQSEYGRIKGKYPDVVGGLPQRVAEASVGGSTRYQLGLGPLNSRDEARRVCESLIQGGERDCLVRSQ